ncbi:MAG: 2-dehydropantoate 2-reductase [Comamonas sp.]
MFRKICIYGVGAIGGWMGAGLAALEGVQVSAVARGRTLAALQANGLLVRRPDDGAAMRETAYPVSVSDDPAKLGAQDLVIVAVKAPAMAEVAERMAPLLAPHTTVLTAMNGVPWWFLQGFGGQLAGTALSSVDPQGRIARVIAPRHVVGCVVHASCSIDEPGVIRHRFGNGLIVGEPSGEATERVRALHALLQRAGFETTLSPQIQKDIWYKLWGNMTINPICAFTGATSMQVLDDGLVRDFVTRVMLEAREIGARIGVPIAELPEDRHRVTRKLGDFKPSMLQDVLAGKAVELDALVASVRELGQLVDVPTPFTDALLGLARLHARVHGLYPA